MKRLKAGIIGAGNICGIYIKNLTTMFAENIELAAVANRHPEKAAAAVENYAAAAVAWEKTPEDLLKRRDIDLIINLTPPAAHFSVAKAALDAGKHVYNEKPLCTNLADAELLLELAQKKGLLVGCSPDTFLGAGVQTAVKLLKDGWIGRPVAGTAFLLNHGPEHWHPAPDFFYAPGGGPLLDMGPYYIGALVSLLGPVAAVTGNAAISHDQRLITSEPRHGEQVAVTTPTHISALLDFKTGAHVSMIMSFDVWSHSLPHIEIYGSEGTLQLGDPNYFISPVKFRRFRDAGWHDAPLLTEGGEARLSWLDNDNWRGAGVADMAQAIAEGRQPRASGDRALHILAVMTGILDSAEQGKRLPILTIF